MNGKGFTLVELLVVVVILGIMAAVALPRFSNTTATARASMLADDLRVMRMQIEVFTGHHNIPPGYPGCDPDAPPTEGAYVQHMTMASKMTGELAAPGTDGYPHGPYLREIPPNPVNEKRTVQIISDSEFMPASADDSHGWVYQPLTKTIRGDCQGQDSHGVSFYSY